MDGIAQDASAQPVNLKFEGILPDNFTVSEIWSGEAGTGLDHDHLPNGAVEIDSVENIAVVYLDMEPGDAVLLKIQDIDCTYEQDVHYDSDQLISGMYIYDSDVYIENGKTVEFSGIYEFNGDLIVEEGAELQIDDETTFNFGDSSALIIRDDGYIDVDNAVFKHKIGGSRGRWVGIRVEDTGGYSYIENSHIKNAINGVYCSTDQRLYVTSCEIEQCEYGFFANTGLFSYVWDSHIHDCSYGYYATAPGPGIDRNLIINTVVEDIDSTGIEFDGVYYASAYSNHVKNIGKTGMRINDVTYSYVREYNNPGNIFENIGKDANMNSDAAVLLDGTTLVQFRNLHVYDNFVGGLKALYGVSISSSTTYHKNIELINNGINNTSGFSITKNYQYYMISTAPSLSNRFYNIYEDKKGYSQYCYLGYNTEFLAENVYWGPDVSSSGEVPSYWLAPYLLSYDCSPIADSAFVYGDGGDYPWKNTSSANDYSALMITAIEMLDSVDLVDDAVLILRDLCLNGYSPALRPLSGALAIQGLEAAEIEKEILGIDPYQSDPEFAKERVFMLGEIWQQVGDFETATKRYRAIANNSESVLDSLLAELRIEKLSRQELILAIQDPSGPGISGNRVVSASSGDPRAQLAVTKEHIHELNALINQTFVAKGTSNVSLPEEFELSPAYPNPFNPTISIPFTLPEVATVRLEVFNVLGQRVSVLADYRMRAGRHTRIWTGIDDNGSTVGSGVYFVRLRAGKFEAVRKIVMVR